MTDTIEVYVNGVKTDDIAVALRKCVVLTDGMAAIRDAAADEIDRLRAGLAEADEQIAALQAKVHLCAAYDRIEKRLAEALNLLENCRPALSEMRESAHTCEDKAAWATLEEDVWRFIDAADQPSAGPCEICGGHKIVTDDGKTYRPCPDCTTVKGNV